MRHVARQLATALASGLIVFLFVGIHHASADQVLTTAAVHGNDVRCSIVNASPRTISVRIDFIGGGPATIGPFDLGSGNLFETVPNSPAIPFAYCQFVINGTSKANVRAAACGFSTSLGICATSADAR